MSRTNQRQKPSLEILEQRQLLTTAVLNAGGTIVITGTPNDDYVRVLELEDGQHYRVQMGLYGSEGTEDFLIAEVDQISFMGLAGNDGFYNETAVAANANGGDGTDYLWSGAGNDTLQGGLGHDWIRGRGGADRLFSWLDLPPWMAPLGDPGGDQLDGGPGADTLTGHSGDDYLLGGAGHDQLFGGGGNGALRGYIGNDSLFGGSGADLLLGQEGHDFIDAGKGRDSLYGGIGNDSLFGGRGADLLSGNEGNDHLYDRGSTDAPADPGLFGADSILGGADYDIAHGFEAPDLFPNGDVEEFQPT